MTAKASTTLRKNQALKSFICRMNLARIAYDPFWLGLLDYMKVVN